MQTPGKRAKFEPCLKLHTYWKKKFCFRSEMSQNHPCSKNNGNKKSLLSPFKTNKVRVAIFDAKKRQTTFMNAIKINYFNRYINKRFKSRIFPPKHKDGLASVQKLINSHVTTKLNNHFVTFKIIGGKYIMKRCT